MLKPVQNLFEDNVRSTKVIEFLQNGGLTPHKSNVFRPFRIDESNLKMVIVNTSPHIYNETASGLLFGCDGEVSSNVYFRNFTNSYAMTVEANLAYDEKAFDFTFQDFLSKNILMINVCPSVSNFQIVGPNDINRKESQTYFWKNILMDEVFYYLNWFDTPLEFLFIGEPSNENINYYQKQITNFYHNIHRVGDFTTLRDISVLKQYI